MDQLKMPRPTSSRWILGLVASDSRPTLSANGASSVAALLRDPAIGRLSKTWRSNLNIIATCQRAPRKRLRRLRPKVVARGEGFAGPPRDLAACSCVPGAAHVRGRVAKWPFDGCYFRVRFRCRPALAAARAGDCRPGDHEARSGDCA